jgi:hypothetical protein
MLHTLIDKMIGLVKKKKRISFGELGKALKIKPKEVETIARILEKGRIVDLHYSLNPISKTWIELKAEMPKEEQEKIEGKKVNSYMVEDPIGKHDIAEVEIYFSQEDKRNKYFIHLPKLSPFTRAFVEHIKSETAKQLPISGTEKTKDEMKKDLVERSTTIHGLIEKKLKPDEKTLKTLTSIAMNEMYGLGNVELLVDDKNLEEIVINSSKVPVSVYHRKMGWMKTNITLKNEEESENYAAQIARKVGRQDCKKGWAPDYYFESDPGCTPCNW